MLGFLLELALLSIYNVTFFLLKLFCYIYSSSWYSVFSSGIPNAWMLVFSLCFIGSWPFLSCQYFFLLQTGSFLLFFLLVHWLSISILLMSHSSESFMKITVFFPKIFIWFFSNSSYMSAEYFYLSINFKCVYFYPMEHSYSNCFKLCSIVPISRF